MTTRHILHADMDAFYASVEQRDNPALRGKPVVVGGAAEGRGVVAACSYEARAFGVRSAMPMGQALRLCPQAVRVSPRFDRYREISQAVMGIFLEITPLVQPISLDEAFLDVTEAVEGGATPVDLAAGIKTRVRETVGLTISVGTGTSKTVAKIASGYKKPDGLTVVAPGTEAAFLHPLPVGKLWGVGPKTEERLAQEGITTIGQLAQQEEAWFRSMFGKRGPEMRRMAWGEDDRPVTPERDVKSVSAETTFARDIGDVAGLRPVVEKLSARVAQRLVVKHLSGRTVTVKLRTADFRTFTRSQTLPVAVSGEGDLTRVAWELVQHELQPGLRFRLVGVEVSHFVDGAEGQLSLFSLGTG